MENQGDWKQSFLFYGPFSSNTTERKKFLHWQLIFHGDIPNLRAKFVLRTSADICLCSWLVLSLLGAFSHLQPERVIILRCHKRRFQWQGFNFSLCSGDSGRLVNKTFYPVISTRRWEESHMYLCLHAVHPLLPSLGPPFRSPHCPQGGRGSALAGCGGSTGGVAESPSSLQGLGGEEKMLGGAESSPAILLANNLDVIILLARKELTVHLIVMERASLYLCQLAWYVFDKSR